MQSSIVTPPVGIAAEDVPELAALVTGATGPFATMLVSTGRDRADRAAQVESVWRELQAGLAEQGAPASVLDEAWSAIEAARPDGASVGVIVADGSAPIVVTHD